MDCSTPTIEFRQRRIHMIGIGGCGMSGAAGILLRLGAYVSGSDMCEFSGMGALVRDGARITIGHDAGLLSPQTDLVVISAAIPETNPELTAARARKLTVIKYAELVGALMRHRRGVAISGTHGKSTTSAMCAHLFREAGLDPSFIFGATSEQLGGSSGVGDGEHFIVESCEYDRSFLHFSPHSSAILNIEPDHLDCYDSFDDIVDAFAEFGGRVHADGLVVCNAHEESVARAVREVGARIETFGFSGDADWMAVNLNATLGCYEFDVWYKGSYLLSTWLSVPGRYNVANALAAVALAHEAGADKTALAMALPTFAGIGRRLTWRGEGRGVTVVDDYAHHPTEVRLTIEAARNRYEPKRTWVVFQPHQYERTHQLMKDFAICFEQADEIIVPDIYAARESNGAAAGSKELVSRIRSNGGRAHYLATLQAAADHVVKHASRGDLVMTMGAGDVWKVADELVERICGPSRVECPVGPDDVVQTGRTSEVPVSTA